MAIQVYDYNSLKSHVFIGDCVLSLTSLLGAIGRETVLESELVNRKGTKAGRVAVFIMLEFDTREKQLEKTAVVEAKPHVMETAAVVAQVMASEPKRRSKRSGNIMDRFAACEKGGKSELDVSQLGLTDWPSETAIFPAIRRLHAFNNQFKALPALGEKFRSLSYLDISRNLLTDLASVKFSTLTGLKHLDISRNFLTHLPADIVKLSSLESLCLHRNRIEHFPAGMDELKSLKIVNAESNSLQSISEEFDRLQWLYELNLADNPDLHIDALPSKARRLFEKVNLMFILKKGSFSQDQ